MSSSAARAKAAPVLALFRKIMRAHREKLPPPVRAMGDHYVHDEFQRHLRGKTTEEQWRIFMAEWQHYHSMLSGVADLVGAATGGGGGGSPAGGSAVSAGMTTTAAAATGSCGELAEDVLQAMTPDQRARLERLRQEAGRFGRDLLSPEGDASSSSSGGGSGGGGASGGSEGSGQAAAGGPGSAPS